MHAVIVKVAEILTRHNVVLGSEMLPDRSVTALACMLPPAAIETAL